MSGFSMYQIWRSKTNYKANNLPQSIWEFALRLLVLYLVQLNCDNLPAILASHSNTHDWLLWRFLSSANALPAASFVCYSAYMLVLVLSVSNNLCSWTYQFVVVVVLIVVAVVVDTVDVCIAVLKAGGQIYLLVRKNYITREKESDANIMELLMQKRFSLSSTLVYRRYWDNVKLYTLLHRINKMEDSLSFFYLQFKEWE